MTKRFHRGVRVKDTPRAIAMRIVRRCGRIVLEDGILTQQHVTAVFDAVTDEISRTLVRQALDRIVKGDW